MTVGDKRIRAGHILAHAYYHLERNAPVSLHQYNAQEYWDIRQAQMLIMKKFYRAIAMPMIAFQDDAPSYTKEY